MGARKEEAHHHVRDSGSESGGGDTGQWSLLCASALPRGWRGWRSSMCTETLPRRRDLG